MITDRELFEKMWQASWRATEAALAAGHNRDSEVVKDSSWRAAYDVYVRERPDEAPGQLRPSPPAVLYLPETPPDDPAKERMGL